MKVSKIITNSLIILKSLNVVVSETTLNLDLQKEENDLVDGLKIRYDESCIIKIFTLYFKNYEIVNDINLNFLTDKEQIYKIIAIELTKCLLENYEIDIYIDDECYPENINKEWNKLQINKCMKTLIEDNILWTTFIGYFNKIDDIYKSNFERIEIFELNKEYKELVHNLNSYLTVYLKEQQDKNDKIITENISKIKYEMNEIIQNLNFTLNTLMKDKEFNQSVRTERGSSKFGINSMLQIKNWSWSWNWGSNWLLLWLAISIYLILIVNFKFENIVLERILAFVVGSLIFHVGYHLSGKFLLTAIESFRQVVAQ